jgi:serine phosphatase RsbU (regulator of sigma subunit)
MVALEPGASLLLASRGVVEGKYKDEEFGLDRLKDTLLKATSDDAKELSLGIINSVEQFMRTPPTHNDVTVLALVRAATGKAVAVGG